MSRILLVLAMLVLEAAGLPEYSLASTRSRVSTRFCDALGTTSESPLVLNDLATEKQKLEKELCEARQGIGAPTVVTERKTEGAKPVVTEHRTEKLPDNKTKEVVVTEETEKLSPSATVKKTVERQVVKGADGRATGNETVTVKKTKTETSPSNETVTETVERQVVKGAEGTATVNETVTVKETRTEASPSNATVTETVKEHKVVKGEEGKEGVKKEIVAEKKEVEKEVETVEKPEPEKLPVNATVKKTSVERKVVKDISKVGEPQKEVVIEKKTQTDTTKAPEIPPLELVNASALDEKAGPTKIVVTQKKIEEFPGNETKEVVVKEQAEKLPSNDTIQTTVVERKITKDTGKDIDRPQQEIVIEKEIEVQITNKTTEVETAEVASAAVEAAGKEKKQEYKEKIENIKRQVQDLKEQIKDEEIKTELDGCVDAPEEKKVEEVTPVVKAVEKVLTVAKPEKEEKKLLLPEVKEIIVEKVVQDGKVIEKQIPVPEKPPVVVTEKKAPEIIGNISAKNVSLFEGKHPSLQTVVPLL